MSIRPSPFALFVALTLVPLSAGAGQSGPRLDRALEQAQREGRSSRVIVQARQGSRTWLKTQLQSQGVTPSDALASIDALSVELTAAQVAAVCGSAAALTCSEDVVVK